MTDHGPAVTHQCKGHENPEFDYPARFEGRVPKTVRVKRTVRSDALLELAGRKPLIASRGETYPAWTNSHGALSAILPCGEKFGLRPHEFEVTEWL